MTSTPAGFVLPANFPIVGLGIIGVTLLNFFQVGKVSAARKESGVKYPNLYASDAEAKADPLKNKFNCAQRVHANNLEFLPFVLGNFAYLSLFYPEIATGALLTWVVGRFFYSINYYTGKPADRNNGLALLAYPGVFTLILGNMYLATTQAIRILS